MLCVHKMHRYIIIKIETNKNRRIKEDWIKIHTDPAPLVWTSLADLKAVIGGTDMDNDILRKVTTCGFPFWLLCNFCEPPAWQSMAPSTSCGRWGLVLTFRSKGSAATSRWQADLLDQPAHGSAPKLSAAWRQGAVKVLTLLPVAGIPPLISNPSKRL